MIVKSTRLGKLDVDPDKLIQFPKGILGFPNHPKYVLIQPSEDSYFYWLQAVDREDLAFVVTDPSLFVPTYRIPIKEEQMHEIGIGSLDEAQVFVIVNKRDDVLTGNLQGPLIIHVPKRVGAQLVLSDRKFTTRVPLVELGVGAETMSAAG